MGLRLRGIESKGLTSICCLGTLSVCIVLESACDGVTNPFFGLRAGRKGILV